MLDGSDIRQRADEIARRRRGRERAHVRRERADLLSQQICARARAVDGFVQSVERGARGETRDVLFLFVRESGNHPLEQTPVRFGKGKPNAFRCFVATSHARVARRGDGDAVRLLHVLGRAVDGAAGLAVWVRRVAVLRRRARGFHRRVRRGHQPVEPRGEERATQETETHALFKIVGLLVRVTPATPRGVSIARRLRLRRGALLRGGAKALKRRPGGDELHGEEPPEFREGRARGGHGVARGGVRRRGHLRRLARARGAVVGARELGERRRARAARRRGSGGGVRRRRFAPAGPSRARAQLRESPRERVLQPVQPGARGLAPGRRLGEQSRDAGDPVGARGGVGVAAAVALGGVS